MQLDFGVALEWLDAAEGVDVSTLPGDAGGETARYGIARRYHMKETPWPPTLERAADIVRLEYWAPLRVAEMSAPLALVVFDTGVNQGIEWAAVNLQAVLGGLRLDGQVGAKTLAAAQHADNETLVKLLVRRARWYAFQHYGPGLLARLFRLQQFMATRGLTW